MGVTFYPTDKKPEPVTIYQRPKESSTADDTLNIALESTLGLEEAVTLKKKLWLSSFSTKPPSDPNIVVVGNSFVDTIIQAYNGHHALIIRPDDVWMAIITQFSFFVNANAESLRGSFVTHEGKKNLHVDLDDCEGDMVDYLTHRFELLLHENTTDPSIREWIMPNFTTTTQVDKTACGIIMMLTFKEYFTYSCSEICGLPSVTLEGTKADWQSLLRRIEKLKDYGAQTTTWYHLLRPILKHFVAAFHDPHSQMNRNFWNKVLHTRHRCGGDLLSGWITAFCVFDRRGYWNGPEFLAGTLETFTEEDTCSTTLTFWSKFFRKRRTDKHKDQGEPSIKFDPAIYRPININNIPPGCVGVDLKLIGLGPGPNGALLAGLCAFKVCDTTAVKPCVGWWLYVKE